MDVEKLKQLLKQPEGLKLEFKQQLYRVDHVDPQQRAIGWDTLIRDIVALANGNVGVSEEPAYLIIGVGDKISADGMRELFDVGNLTPTAVEILSRVNASCYPPIPDINCEALQIDGSNTFVITIPPTPYLHETVRRLVGSNGKTEYREGSVFIRVGETIRLASLSEVTGILADKRKSLKYSTTSEEPKPSVFVFTFDLLHPEIVKRCRNLFQSAY